MFKALYCWCFVDVVYCLVCWCSAQFLIITSTTSSTIVDSGLCIKENFYQTKCTRKRILEAIYKGFIHLCTLVTILSLLIISEDVMLFCKNIAVALVAFYLRFLISVFELYCIDLLHLLLNRRTKIATAYYDLNNWLK